MAKDKKMKWVLLSIGAVAISAAVAIGYKFLTDSPKSPLTDSDDIDGGVVTRRWDNVPKEIESDEIVEFHCEISLYAVCDVDDIGNRLYKLDATMHDDCVTVKYDRRDRSGRSGEGEYTADEDFMYRLQAIVSNHNFAQHNGYYHKVSGLPDMYGESLDVTYASGESIYVYDNQSGFLPLEAVRELIALFGAATEIENK